MNAWFVRETGFASRMEPEDRSTFMRVCPDVRYAQGNVIFRLGDPATHMHVIAEGQVKLVTPTASGHERILAICGPDDFIGEAFIHEADTYRVDAVALTHTTTCPMSRSQFKELALKAPSVSLGFMEILASHLFDCRQQLESAFDPIRTRVAKALLDQCRRFGTPTTEDGSWYTLHTELKHEDIASLTSATRVSVTTAFTSLREDGFVEGSRGRYRVNVDALASLADGIEDMTR